MCLLFPVSPVPTVPERVHHVMSSFRETALRSMRQDQIYEISMQKGRNHIHRAGKFGDLIAADHKILNEEGGSINNNKYVMIVQDMATQWIVSYPRKAKKNFTRC